jgi:hypothetical protein
MAASETAQKRVDADIMLTPPLNQLFDRLF